MDDIRENAELYRYLYRTNQCSRLEAQENIKPYLELIYNKSIDIGKKYNRKPTKINFATYVR